MTGHLSTTFRKMDTISQLWLIAVFISVQLVSPSYCTDKLFVAEARNAEILMAEAIDYSFINTTFIKIPLNGLILPVGVEFDPRSELIYWTDAILHTVNRAALDGSFQEVIAQLQNVSGKFEYPYGIALNLDDDKVYWTDQYRDVIEMANLDGTDRTDLLTTGFNSHPNAIVYSSFRRKIYWTDRGQYAKLEMANPDGSERTTLLDGDIDSNFTHPTGISLDFLEQRLYWTDTTVDRIEHLNLDDLQRHVSFWTTTEELDLYPFGISNYFEDIYFADFYFDGVYALDFPYGDVYLVNSHLPSPAEIHIYAETSCPGINMCASTGTCVIYRRQPQTNARCICDKGYTGTHCESDIIDCNPNSCINGECIDGVDSFSCACIPGFTDSTCSTDIDDCDPDPCMNGGICTDGVDFFTCACVSGYNDSTCTTDIDECDSDPCMNGGTCIDGVDSFTCDCVAGYTNSTCSTNINDCDPEPCMNGGTCIDGVDSFTCNCVTSYTGSTCDRAFDVCLWINPCGMNEECTNTDVSHSGYYCNCSESFERRNSVCMASRSVGVSVKFTRLNGQVVTFTDALRDPMSEEYRKLETLCYKILFDVLMNIMSTQGNEWDIEITGFKEGSIVVDYQVTVFDSDKGILNDQAAELERSLGLQEPGVWQSGDGSVSLNVQSIDAVGEICLQAPCSNGICVTSPGDVNYRCICHYGYTGQHCETEITCPLPNHPYSHVVKAESLYRGGDFITIQCDENEESVVWQCNGTSGQWKQLADLDCKPEDEPVGGISTGAIIGILAAVVIVLVLGMIFYFLYKMANRKRQTTTDGVMLSEQRNQQLPEVQGRDNRGDFPQFNRQFGRTGTLPAPLNFTSLDHKEGPTPDDLPPAYDFNSGPECSGGVCSSDYEEIIHVCTKPDDDLPSPKPNRYIDVQMNT